VQQKMSAAVWKWGLAAAMLIVVIWQSGMVLTFRIVEFPAEAFTAGYNLEARPLWLAWLMVIMSSLVAGICEETGYRGYMQVPLEERYSPGVAITIVSIWTYSISHTGGRTLREHLKGKR
jgi:membrane protease YdiL (CAAX protease family)